MTTFDMTIAQSLYDSNDRFPVDFDDAWKWLGYGRKDNALRGFLLNGFDEGVDFVVSLFKEENSEPSEGRPSDDYRLTVDCLKTFAMMAKTEAGKQVRRYFLQCEKLAKESAKTIDALQAQVKGLNVLLQAKPKTTVQREVVKRVAPADTVQKLRCEANRVWADFGPHDPIAAKSIVARLLTATDRFLQEYCEEKIEVASLEAMAIVEKEPETYATVPDHLEALGFKNPKAIAATMGQSVAAYCKREGLTIIKGRPTNARSTNKYPLSSILFALALKGLTAGGSGNA